MKKKTAKYKKRHKKEVINRRNKQVRTEEQKPMSPARRAFQDLQGGEHD